MRIMVTMDTGPYYIVEAESLEDVYTGLGASSWFILHKDDRHLALPSACVSSVCRRPAFDDWDEDVFDLRWVWQ